jgi:hypothetical protein
MVSTLSLEISHAIGKVTYYRLAIYIWAMDRLRSFRKARF